MTARAVSVEDRLRGENVEYAQLVGNLSRLLTATADGLKGTPRPLHWHDWSDLPWRAADLRKAAREMLDVVAADSRYVAAASRLAEALDPSGE